MKSKYMCKILLCSVILLLSISSQACAETEPADNAIFSCSQAIGNSARNLDDLFNGELPENSENVPVLSDVSFFHHDDRLTLKASLSYYGAREDFSTSGILYKNEKTKNSGMCENLVLGEMDDFDYWHFVQLRVDKDREAIIIILQDINTMELLQFKIPIDADQFDMFYTLQENSLHESELELKIIELYSVSRNLIGHVPETGSFQYSSPGSYGSSSSP